MYPGARWVCCGGWQLANLVPHPSHSSCHPCQVHCACNDYSQTAVQCHPFYFSPLLSWWLGNTSANLVKRSLFLIWWLFRVFCTKKFFLLSLGSTQQIIEFILPTNNCQLFSLPNSLQPHCLTESLLKILWLQGYLPDYTILKYHSCALIQTHHFFSDLVFPAAATYSKVKADCFSAFQPMTGLIWNVWGFFIFPPQHWIAMKQSRNFFVSLLEKHPISYKTSSCILVLWCSKMSDTLLTGQGPTR